MVFFELLVEANVFSSIFLYDFVVLEKYSETMLKLDQINCFWHLILA